jgi:hypothetical protein
MAQAIEQYTPLDEDRWTLNQVFDHLTVTLGYSKERALHEMERERLAGRLVVQVHKVIDGTPQGDPEYLPPDKKHKLVLDLGWVRPLALKWSGGDRCTVYKQRVLELWPPRPPASRDQPEDKAVPYPIKVDTARPFAPQRRPAKASEPDSGAKPSRKPSPAQADRDAAINRRLDKGEIPGSTVTWMKFSDTIRDDCSAFIGDPKKRKFKRGFSDDAIEEVTRKLMKSLPR